MQASLCLTRRALLSSLIGAGAAALVPPPIVRAQAGPIMTRPIPSSGEALPLVGLGTWITFNVGEDGGGARLPRRGHAELLRQWRAIDRFFANVRIVAIRRWGRSRTSWQSAGALFGRQGVDAIRFEWSGSDRGVTKILGHRALRPSSGSQSPRLGRASGDAVRHEGGRHPPLCRDHDLGGASAP